MNAKEKLQGLIDAGKNRVNSVLKEIEDEHNRRIDYIVKPSKIDYEITYPDTDNPSFEMMVDGQAKRLTDWSKSQLFTKTGVPPTYAKRLLKLGEFDLFKTNMNKMTQRILGDGVMLREIGQGYGHGLIKGVLSPSYKRIDVSPLITEFVTSMTKEGYVPYEAKNTWYRYRFLYLNPELYEPVKNEFIVFGVGLTSSDYGASSFELEMMILRIWCSNLAIGYDIFKKIHLGKRFTTIDEMVDISQRTIALDDATVRSAIRDAVKSSRNHIKILNNMVHDKATEPVHIDQFMSDLKKKGIRKEISETIKKFYETEESIEILPSIKGKWRLANAISYIAQRSQNPDEQIDLEKEAMKVLSS